jgi:hypothetical protein
MLLLAALGVLGLAACGGGDDTGGSGASTTATQSGGGGGSQLEGLSAQEVLDKAKEAAKSAKSVHVAGEATDDSGTAKLDLTLTSDGGFGSVEQVQGEVDVVLIGNDVYAKLDEKLLASTVGAGNEEIAKLVGGKWIKAAADSPQFSSFADLVKLSSFIDGVLSPEGEITREEGKEISGTPTVALKDGGSDGGLLYIADEGKPYPLAIEPGAGSGDSGQVTFSDWDKDVTITPPPAGEVIDFSKLPGG